MLKPLPPGPVNVIKAFVDRIKLRLSSAELGWALIQHDRCPYKKRKMQRQADREEGHVKTQAETEVRHPQAKEGQEFLPVIPEAEKGIELLGTFRGSRP